MPTAMRWVTWPSQLYGGGNGSAYIDYNGGSFSAALAQTRELMTSMLRAPIFEATLQHDGVLVREDILLPVHGQRAATAGASSR